MRSKDAGWIVRLTACLLLAALAGLAAVPAPSSAHGLGSTTTARVETTAVRASDPGPGWTALGPSALVRGEAGAAVVRGSVYVVGGFLPPLAETTNKVERYDPEADRWELVASMPVALNHPSAVRYRRKLYVLGGYTGGISNPGVPTGGAADASDAFLRYDLKTESWSRMPPMPVPRSAFAAAVIGHRLYVAGGRERLPTYATSAGLLRRLDIFNFRTRRWHRGPDMSIAREHVPGVALDGAFYVLGGRTAIPEGATAAVERYLPKERRWERVADMGIPHNGFGAVRVRHTIVAFGGEEPSTSQLLLENPFTERYRPRTDRWTELPPMRTPRGAVAAAAVGRRVLAIEGVDAPPTTSCCAFTNTVEQLRLPRRGRR